jgi:hypothetical protein
MSPEDLSYISVADAQILGDEYIGKFIVHAEGNPRVIYKLWQEFYEEISPDNTEVYFSLKNKDYFKNHCAEVIPGLYKYRR